MSQWLVQTELWAQGERDICPRRQSEVGVQNGKPKGAQMVFPLTSSLETQSHMRNYPRTAIYEKYRISVWLEMPSGREFHSWSRLMQPAETGKEECEVRAVVTGQAAAECTMSSVKHREPQEGSSDVGLEGEMLI